MNKTEMADAMHLQHLQYAPNFQFFSFFFLLFCSLHSKCCEPAGMQGISFLAVTSFLILGLFRPVCWLSLAHMCACSGQLDFVSLHLQRQTSTSRKVTVIWCALFSKLLKHIYSRLSLFQT